MQKEIKYQQTFDELEEIRKCAAEFVLLSKNPIGYDWRYLAAKKKLQKALELES
jgi:hypothetical protein